jgi:hypothetical protein
MAIRSSHHVSTSPPAIPDGRISRVPVLTLESILLRPSNRQGGLNGNAYTPRLSVVYLQDSVLYRGVSFRLSVRIPPTRTLQVPRAPLHVRGITPPVAVSPTTSVGATPPSSLVRTHAPDQKAPIDFGFTYFNGSLQVVVTPRCLLALPDVISANLSLRARTPTPAALVVHSPVSSHKTLAFPKMSSGRRFSGYPCFSNFSTGDFSRLQSFVYLQARRFARHPGCSHRNTFRCQAAVASTSPPISARYLPEQGIC